MTSPTATGPDLLSLGDFLRAPVLAHARPGQVKEWHHVVVHRPGWRVLINFSLTDDPGPDGAPRFVPRVTVIAHDRGWTGGVHRFAESELAVAADLRSMTVGPNRIGVDPSGCQVTLDLPEHDIAGELSLTPATRPFVVTNQRVGDGRLSWLFVPQLRASGWLRVAGTVRELQDAVAYHDHNWGRFRWGDDFGWEWSSILATDPAQPWSFVFSRITDRRRLRVLHQGLFVWYGTEPAAVFRDARVSVRRDGRLDRPPDCTLPPAMNLLAGGTSADVPAEIRIAARRGADEIELAFRSRSFARIMLPSEVDLDRTVTLTETSGTARALGTLGAEPLDVEGVGIVEVLHG